MSKLGFDLLVMALKTAVVCEVFRLMVEAEEGRVAIRIGFVLNVAEEIKIVFELSADKIELFGSVKADVSVECLSGFKFVNALTSITLLRYRIDTLLDHCALYRWLVEDKLEQFCQVLVCLGSSLVLISAKIDRHVFSELVNQKGVVVFEHIDKPSDPLVPLNWKSFTEILLAGQTVTANI